MYKKVVVILSGGMDSATLLEWLRKTGSECRALSFDYGQRHKKELKYASRFCRSRNVKHKVVDLKSITSLINNSALTGKKSVPHGHYEAPSMKQTVVPNRNMILLSIAIGYAENLGFQAVAFANHSGDHAIYPDCRPEFVQFLNKASTLGTYNAIRLYAPFTHLTKSEIAVLGKQLEIDFDDTWSCYEGGRLPCNQCGTCVERIEALSYAIEHSNDTIIPNRN